MKVAKPQGLLTVSLRLPPSAAFTASRSQNGAAQETKAEESHVHDRRRLTERVRQQRRQREQDMSLVVHPHQHQQHRNNDEKDGLKDQLGIHNAVFRDANESPTRRQSRRESGRDGAQGTDSVRRTQHQATERIAPIKKLSWQGASLRARRRRAEDCPPYRDRFQASLSLRFAASETLILARLLPSDAPDLYIPKRHRPVITLERDVTQI